jgi:TRAP-type C4-dicarboxylate transport system permease small subunit
MRLATLAAALSKAGAAVGATALAAMIVLITAQVVSRRLMAIPMVVADELAGWLLVVVTFSALGYALHRGDHIRVTLITDRLPARTRRVLRKARGVIGIPVVLILLWRTSVLAFDSYQSGTFSVSATHFILWPVQVFMPLGFLILLIQMVADLLDSRLDSD